MDIRAAWPILEKSMRKVDLIITRHQALIELLIERGIATSETPVHTGTVDIETVRGKHVAGVLPFELAAAAKSVTQIPLAITPDDRGKELPIERLRKSPAKPNASWFQISSLLFSRNKMAQHALS